MLSRSVSAYEIEGWKGCSGGEFARTTPSTSILLPPPPPLLSWNRAPLLNDCRLDLMLWKMAVHSRPILQVFFFIKRRERERESKVMNPIFQHRIIRSFPRGWIVILRDLLFVSRSILGSEERRHFFFFFFVFTSLEISPIFTQFKCWREMYFILVERFSPPRCSFLDAVKFLVRAKNTTLGELMLPWFYDRGYTEWASQVSRNISLWREEKNKSLARFLPL